MLAQARVEGPREAGPLTLGRLLERWGQLKGGAGPATLADLVADDGGLTDAGRLLMQLLAGREARPQYDAGSRELRWQGLVVKRLQRAGCNQQTVLEAFEQQGWPARIDDPLQPDRLTDTKTRLRETVRALNEKQGVGARIRFHSDDGGVRWETVGAIEERS